MVKDVDIIDRCCVTSFCTSFEERMKFILQLICIQHDNRSSEFASFLAACLTKQTNKRATIDELLRHPFIADMTSSSASASIIKLSAEAHAEVTEEELDEEASVCL